MTKEYAMFLSTVVRDLRAPDLFLHPLSLEDDTALLEILSDTETMKYWSSPPLTHISEVQKLLQEEIDSGKMVIA